MRLVQILEVHLYYYLLNKLYAINLKHFNFISKEKAKSFILLLNCKYLRFMYDQLRQMAC